MTDRFEESIARFRYWLPYSGRFKNERTIEQYVTAAGRLAAWARSQGRESFAELAKADLRSFLSSLPGRGGKPASASSQATIHWAIRSLFRYLAEEEGIPDIAKEITIGRPQASDRVTHLDREEIGRLLKACDGPRELAIVSVALDAGLRISELASLRVTDVCLDNLRARRILVTGKGGKTRAVIVGVSTARALLKYLGWRAKQPGADLPDLWLGVRGRLTVSGLDRLIRLAGTRAGLNVNPHLLRHSWAHMYQRRGVASDATFRVWREDGLAGPAALPGVRRACGPAAGHAVDQGFLAAGCGGCQDVASDSVALDDRWLHLVSRAEGAGMGAVRGPLALVAADGAVPVSPGAALLEEMLAGWRRQQQARRLTIRLIGERERVVRQFAAYTGCWPWQWSAAQAETWVASGGWAHSTVRSYQGALALFLEYVCDPRYGWVSECEQRAGAVPVQVFHERNTAVHVSEHEGRPERRPLTRAELQAFFDAADGHVERAAGWRRKGWLAAFRDATLFKVVYGWGLRRREAAMLDVADFAPSPAAPEFGGLGVCHVRYGKAMRGSPPRRRAVAAVMPWAVQALAQYLDEVRPRYGAHAHPALWLTERGERVSPRGIDERFAAWRAAAGLPAGLSVHCLRHSYVSHLIEDGADPLFVQFLLSPREDVHDVHHEPGGCGSLRAGGGYLRSSITQIPRRFDACAAGADARLVA